MQKFWQKMMTAGRKGFTMVELLVVIAILGILSVVAISALDPIEQINKGRDTTTRSDATEIAQGIDRWYANTQMYPWNDSTVNTASGATAGTAGALLAWGYNNMSLGTPSDSSSLAWLTLMETGGELKTGFGARIAGTRKFAVLKQAATTSSTTEVCFLPTSKAFKKEAVARCADTTQAVAALQGVNPCTTGSEMICVP